MDFTLDEGARAAASAMEPILKRSDPDVWSRVVETGLAGLCVSEDRGGEGQGMIAASEVLRLCGRHNCDEPLASTIVVGAAAIDMWWREKRQPVLDNIMGGRCVVANGVGEPSTIVATRDGTHRDGGDRWRLSGGIDAIPHAARADLLLLPVRLDDSFTATAVISTVADGVSVLPQWATHGGSVARVVLRDVRLRHEQLLGEPGEWDAAHRWVLTRTLVALCALHLGIAEGVLSLTHEHVGKRQQFGRPLGAFQATALRLADAHIAVEALRTHVWRAAWSLDQGRDSSGIAEIARLWSVRVGQSTSRTGHQLHGGVGVDLDYPLHHFTRRAAWLSQRLGGASSALQTLGDMVAAGSIRVGGAEPIGRALAPPGHGS